MSTAGDLDKHNRKPGWTGGPPRRGDTADQHLPKFDRLWGWGRSCDQGWTHVRRGTQRQLHSFEQFVRRLCDGYPREILVAPCLDNTLALLRFPGLAGQSSGTVMFAPRNSLVESQTESS
jgi:hypothetical protein